jgi:alkanesulfonate monooxygenase SsuD/methylene tetrahydromethanopterin reductase-like flavin-dependent oxidoreductase (luciferase family)
MGLSFSISLENRMAALDPDRGFRGMLAAAARADDSPFEAVWVNDSIIDTPGFEPLVTLGAVAAATKRIRLGTGILQPHFRHPALLALAWATLDHASGGRMILGLGVGGGSPENVRSECELFGIDTSDRGSVLESTIGQLRQIWMGNSPNVSLPVRPMQPQPPVWLAAGVYAPHSEEVAAQGSISSAKRGRYLRGRLDRVARLADGWLTIMATPEEFALSSQMLDEEAREVSRDPTSITRALEIWVNVGDNRSRCRQQVDEAIGRYFGGAPLDEATIDRWILVGSPASCLEQLQRFQSSGVQHVKLVIGAPDVDRQFDAIVEGIVEPLVARGSGRDQSDELATQRAGL